MSKKLVDHGDLFEGNLRILGDIWVLGCSARGYVWVKKVGSDLMVTEEIPDYIPKSGPEYSEELWNAEMRKIRDVAIAKARELARQNKRKKK